MCGGTAQQWILRQAFGGLSPRVRGNLTPICAGICVGRTIPACAGEPSNAPEHLDARGDYPRVCGGTCYSPSRRCHHRGLSPRVRGNQDNKVIQPLYGGTIPACAGEPSSARNWGSNERDYPRVCGGTRRRLAGQRQAPGLSPRVRGNLGLMQERSRDLGTIPACAGEPKTHHPHWHRTGDYPRVCGGTPPKWRWSLPGSGLSPRVRGNLVR